MVDVRHQADHARHAGVAFDLGAGTVVRFADATLNERVNRYLELVAASRDQYRRTLTIATTGQGVRRLYVSYVSEVPVWKTTYRIVMPDDAAAKPLLQGWAIVDNTVGDMTTRCSTPASNSRAPGARPGPSSRS